LIKNIGGVIIGTLWITGVLFDFSEDFFSQWKALCDKIPFQSLSNSKAVNSDYCNVAEESYDSYLCSASWNIERTMYCDSISEIKDSSDLYVVHKSEFCYDDIYCQNSNRLFYSEKSISCIDSYFLYDCRNCTNCFMSSNLRNKSYVFYNKQLTKEEYRQKISKINLSSYDQIEILRKEFKSLKINSIHKFSNIINSNNSTGDNIDHAENCRYCFDSNGGLKDSAYVFWTAKGINETMYSGPGIGWGESIYEGFDAGAGGGNFVSCSVVYYSTNIYYSFNCYNSHDLFGCIGLRNKSYCILNRQYTKEEYFEMIEKIKKHMSDMPYFDKKGRVYRYGEFFPIELSPFAYNETVAQSFYPLTKEEVIEKGYFWRDKEEKKYIPTQTYLTLPDDIKDIDDAILNDVIECINKDKNDRCPTAFKVTKDELSFYRRFSIPIPRKCYQCRHKERFEKRNPLKLFDRSCMCENKGHFHGDEKCTTQFKTSYSPDRPEIIYCEDCYKQEVI
jgi:hypothetical protein